VIILLLLRKHATHESMELLKMNSIKWHTNTCIKRTGFRHLLKLDPQPHSKLSADKLFPSDRCNTHEIKHLAKYVISRH